MNIFFWCISSKSIQYVTMTSSMECLNLNVAGNRGPNNILCYQNSPSSAVSASADFHVLSMGQGHYFFDNKQLCIPLLRSSYTMLWSNPVIYLDHAFKPKYMEYYIWEWLESHSNMVILRMVSIAFWWIPRQTRPSAAVPSARWERSVHRALEAREEGRTGTSGSSRSLAWKMGCHWARQGCNWFPSDLWGYSGINHNL